MNLLQDQAVVWFWRKTTIGESDLERQDEITELDEIR